MRIPYSLILAAASFAIVLVLTPLVAAFARRVGALDHPGARRIHREPVPTLGGLAMIAGVLGVAWLSRTLPGPALLLENRPLLGITVATLPVLALGLIDDLRGMPPVAKLLFQVIAAATLVGFGYGVPYLSNPFGAPIASGPLDPILTIGWVVLIMNAINLIDGLDGLAAGVVMIASATLWWVGRMNLVDFYIMFVSSVLIGSTLGFLRYNFPPARIFMGDTGSNFLGMTIAAVSLLEYRKGTALITLMFPLVAMALPLADGALAFFRRLASGKSVFRADSEHIHHRLLRLGLSQRAVVLVLWFLSAYLGTMAIVLANLPSRYQVMLAVVLGAGLLFAFLALEFVDQRLRRSAEDDPENSER